MGQCAVVHPEDVARFQVEADHLLRGGDQFIQEIEGSELVSRVKSVLTFSQELEQQDDLTLIVLKFKEDSGTRAELL